MKAILRWSLGIFALVALGSVSDAYIWISPVYRRPYFTAPDTCTARYYYLDPWGRVEGPYFALYPPFPPVANPTPGPVGHAIASGNLPHTLLMSKAGVDLGDAPLLKDRGKKGGPPAHPPAPHGPPPGYGAAPGGYPVLGGPDMARYGNVQQPYAGVPMQPYPLFTAPPPAMAPYPLPIPGPTLPAPHPAMMPQPAPRPAGPIVYAPVVRYGSPIYQVQMSPFTPIPNFQTPTAPMQPMQPMPPGMTPDLRAMPQGPPNMMPMMPSTPNFYPTMPMQPYAQGMNPMAPVMPMQPYPFGMQSMAPMQPFGQGMSSMAPMQPLAPGVPRGYAGLQPFGSLSPVNPVAPLNPFAPMNPMAPPMAQMAPLQIPMMEYPPPPPQRAGGSMYPTHPFTRSPRDFFMWAENLEEERLRGNRLPSP